MKFPMYNAVTESLSSKVYLDVQLILIVNPGFQIRHILP